MRQKNSLSAPLKAASTVRRTRGQRVDLVCERPGCGKAISRERSAYRPGQPVYCSRSCIGLMPRPSYRVRKQTLFDALTSWFAAHEQHPIRVGLYRVQTAASTGPEAYFDAWWEDDRWWIYDDERRRRTCTPFGGVLRWRGRLIPPQQPERKGKA